VTTEQGTADDRARLEFLVDSDDIPGPVSTEFLSLAAALMGASTVRGVLQRVVEAAKSVVPGADLVSVTLRAAGGFHTPVEAGALASRLDEIQYRIDDGPCVDATRRAGLGLTFCSDLATSTRFGAFGPVAAELGVHSVLAVGLFPDGDGPRMGALNVYSHAVAGFDELDRELALVLAAHASTALVATMAATSAELEAAQLRQALQSRDVIGQAKGILMERRKISADEAFGVLRSASQSLNVKLAQVAQTVVDHRSGM